MKIQYRLATQEDSAELARLEKTYMNDELSSPAESMSGQCFSKTDISELIRLGWIMLAEISEKQTSAAQSQASIIGYVIAGPWSWFKSWGIYALVMRKLSDIGAGFSKITAQNSCQYGPIWIHPDFRGQGIFAKLVEKLSCNVAKKYPYMVTFIAEENQASFTAHTGKSAMEVVDYFSFQQRDYYLLLMKN